jgi:hypothetical protein
VLEESSVQTLMCIEDVPLAAQVDTSERAAALAIHPHRGRGRFLSFGRAMPRGGLMGSDDSKSMSMDELWTLREEARLPEKIAAEKERLEERRRKIEVADKSYKAGSARWRS